MRARRKLAGKGWAAIVVAVMLLAVFPMFMHGPLAALGPALRPAGWIALTIGVALLALHYVVQRLAEPVKRGKRDDSDFWGCSNYPNCKTTFVMRPA